MHGARVHHLTAAPGPPPPSSLLQERVGIVILSGAHPGDGLRVRSEARAMAGLASELLGVSKDSIGPPRYNASRETCSKYGCEINLETIGSCLLWLGGRCQDAKGSCPEDVWHTAAALVHQVLRPASCLGSALCMRTRDLQAEYARFWLST